MSNTSRLSKWCFHRQKILKTIRYALKANCFLFRWIRKQFASKIWYYVECFYDNGKSLCKCCWYYSGLIFHDELNTQYNEQLIHHEKLNLQVFRFTWWWRSTLWYSRSQHHKILWAVIDFWRNLLPILSSFTYKNRLKMAISLF